MKIEVAGPGCPRCGTTAENVSRALKELGIDASVEKITDINVMLDRGVLQSPALIIDGRIVIQGRIPTVEQAKQFITGEKHP
jgi:small redox-active disulfide protein 2